MVYKVNLFKSTKNAIFCWLSSYFPFISQTTQGLVSTYPVGWGCLLGLVFPTWYPNWHAQPPWVLEHLKVFAHPSTLLQFHQIRHDLRMKTTSPQGGFHVGWDFKKYTRYSRNFHGKKSYSSSSFTIWLFNIAMENHHLYCRNLFKWAIYTMAMLVITNLKLPLDNCDLWMVPSDPPISPTTPGNTVEIWRKMTHL